MEGRMLGQVSKPYFTAQELDQIINLLFSAMRVHRERCNLHFHACTALASFATTGKK